MKVQAYRSAHITIPCAAGSKSFSIPYQKFLEDKCIQGIFKSNNTNGINGELLTTDEFYVQIFAGDQILYELGSEAFLDYNNQSLLIMNRSDIDFSKCFVIFAANLAAPTTVELIVFYNDYPNDETIGKKK